MINMLMKERGKCMNLPNKLTVIRLIMVPIFIAVYLIPEAMGMKLPEYHVLWTTMTSVDMIAFFVFALASITDFLDGKLARANNLVTTFGKFVDPVADKMLVNSALILLTVDGKIPVLILIIMVLRDTLVDAIRFLAANNNVVIAASIWGKAKTMTQMIAICLLLLNNPIFSAIHLPMDQIMIYLATFFSVASGLNYLAGSKDFITESM